MSAEGNYLLRSLMFVPAHNKRLMSSAIKTKADVLLLDIEDSVQPNVNKQHARNNIVEYVNSGMFSDHLVFPRINDRESGELLKDIMQLSIPGINGFMYPKAQSGNDIYFIDKLLDVIECEKNLPNGSLKLIPLIETTSAILNINDICKSSKRVIAIAFGCEDFVTDLSGINDKNGLAIMTPRAIIAIAARSNNIIPIDTVHTRVHDLEDLERNLKISKTLGYEGMLVLNPIELEKVHEYFSPSDIELHDAQQMLYLANEAVNNGKGVALVNNRFIGPPMVLAAEKICRKYELIKKKGCIES